MRTDTVQYHRLLNDYALVDHRPTRIPLHTHLVASFSNGRACCRRQLEQIIFDVCETEIPTGHLLVCGEHGIETVYMAIDKALTDRLSSPGDCDCEEVEEIRPFIARLACQGAAAPLVSLRCRLYFPHVLLWLLLLLVLALRLECCRSGYWCVLTWLLISGALRIKE